MKRIKTDTRGLRRRISAALLCGAMALVMLSACGGNSSDATTTRPTLPPTTLPEPKPVIPKAFKVEEYDERAKPAAGKTNQLELSSMCTDAAFMKDIAGDIWDKVVQDPSQRGYMRASRRTIYEDKSANTFLVIGEPIPNVSNQTFNCYLLVQKSDPPKVLAAWTQD